MKNKIIILGMFVAAMLTANFTACAPDYETNFEEKKLVVPNRDLTPIAFTIEGGQKEIRVETNVSLDSWQAFSNADWCKVTRSEGKVAISVGKSEMYVTRNARITIKYGHQEYTIPVTQNSITSTLLIEGKQEGYVKQAGVNGGELVVTATSNLKIDYITVPDVSSDWLSFISVTDVAGTDAKTLKFSLKPSYNTEERSAIILVQSSQNPALIATFTVTQAKRVAMPIPLTVAMLSANATQSGDGGGLPALIDNDKNTYYHTLWSAVSPGGKPHYVQFNLNTAIQLFKIEYVSRNSGDGGGDVKRAGIWVSTTGGDTDAEWTKAGTMTFPLPTARGLRTSSNEMINFGQSYKYIRFVPEARRSADPLVSTGKVGWWNMADIYLYTF